MENDEIKSIKIFETFAQSLSHHQLELLEEVLKSREELDSMTLLRLMGYAMGYIRGWMGTDSTPLP